MGMGIGGSLLVGWLLDNVGLEICTAMTLLFGQLQMAIVILGSDKESWMIASFVAYTSFRAFLYPVFIGSLTHRLGFKYFGILLGLGFAVSGIVQLMFPKLVELSQGDCHLSSMGGSKLDGSNCDHGKWQQSEVLQFILLGVMYIVPVLDRCDAVRRKREIQELLLSKSPKISYGTGAQV